MRDFDEYNKDYPKYDYEGEPFDEPDNLGSMGLFDHLEELRWCVARTIVAMIICFPIGLYFVDDFISFCASLSKVESLAAFNPAENFLQRFRVAFLLSLFVCLPYVLMQIWSFIAPGLYDKERKWVGYSVLASYLLFASGAIFGLFIISPMALDFFHGLQTETVRNVLRLSETVTFVFRISIAMGIVLQLPIVVILLNLLNVVDLETIKKSRQYVILGVFILAAVLTPPDFISQIMLAVPTIILFELALLFCAFMETDPEVRERNKSRNLTIAVVALFAVLVATSFGVYRVYQLKSGKVFEQSFASLEEGEIKGLASNETGEAKLMAMLDFHGQENLKIEDKNWSELLDLWKKGELSDAMKAKLMNYAFNLQVETLRNLEGERRLNIMVKQRESVPVKFQALWSVEVGNESYFWPGENNQYRYDQSLGVFESLSRPDVLSDLPRLKKALEQVGDHEISFVLKITKLVDLNSKKEVLWLDKLSSQSVKWEISTEKTGEEK